MESDDDGGASPLHLAVWHNNEVAFTLLLERKVKLDSVWAELGNVTPLQLAVSMERHIMASRLSIGLKFEKMEGEISEIKRQLSMLLPPPVAPSSSSKGFGEFGPVMKESPSEVNK